MLKSSFLSANTTFFSLLKIMVPAIIIIKIMEILGAITWLAKTLDPVMGILGLPGETGLVWATCLLANLFAAVLVFFDQVDYQSLTVMQTSILASMMLIGHVIIVEGAIAKKVGLSWWLTILYRIGGAILFGFLIKTVCQEFGLLQQSVSLSYIPSYVVDQSLWQWSLDQFYSLIILYLMLLGLVLLINFMKKSGINDLLERMLAPLLYIIGIKRSAASLTMIGMLLGLAYGGGLLMNESKRDNIDKKDIFLSMSLISLFHSLIEDTLVVLLLGPSFWVIVPFRLLFALVIVKILHTTSLYYEKHLVL